MGGTVVLYEQVLPERRINRPSCGSPVLPISGEDKRGGG